MPGGFALANRPFPGTIEPDHCRVKMTESPAILVFEIAWTTLVDGNLARLEELTHLSLISFP